MTIEYLEEFCAAVRLQNITRAAGCRLVGISDREFSFSLCLCWRPDNGNPALERFLSYFSAAQTKS